MKFKYTINPDSEEPIMLLNKHIGMDEEDGEGIMGDVFQTELMYLDSLGKKRIQVYVCSPGGSVVEGMKIYNAILKTKTKVDTYNGGMAASMAGVICQAGRTRYMSDYALLMMHNPFNSGGEDTPELKAFKNSIVTMLKSKNPNATENEISKYMDATTWMNADEAKAAGFCDVIEASSDHNKPRIKTVTDAKQSWKEICNYFNSINLKPAITMKKVYNKLKLVDGSTEDAVVASIEAIENKAKMSEEEKEAMKKELDEAKDKYDKLKAKFDDQETANKAAKDEADNKAKIALENSSKILAEGAAKAGKIKNDAATIKLFTDKAVADYDGVKAMLDAMPVNKPGAKIVDTVDGVKTGEENTVKPYSMAGTMMEVSNKNKQR